LTYFEEEQLSYTTALHCKLRSSKKEDDNETTYHVGPMARYAINFEHLPSDIQQVALSVGLEPICRNPFKSIIVRAIEVLYACSEAVRIIRNYDMPSVSSIAINGETFHGNHSGCAATEAPRGLLYHRYSIDTEGNIADAKIIPPTSQNQRQIEDDLWQVVNRYADSSDEELRYVAEQTIRNYDPCISCATHFLKLEIDRQ
jgi:coenzyme F420-reducing hydrogenase alpha subunit